MSLDLRRTGAVSLLALSVVQAAAVLGGGANASDAPPQPFEIVVLGRPSSAFDAPGAVVRLSGDALSGQGVTTLDDLAPVVAGLHLINDQDPGTNILSLRGATTDRLQAAAVAFLVDGAALPDTELFTAPLFDLADVTVLKGPQGALFGKNAAGGAIAVSTARGPGGSARATLGDGGRREAEIAYGGAEGWRVAGLWTAADGWLRNTTLGRVVDAEERKAVRVSAARTLGAWSLDAAVQALEEDGGAAWASSGDVTGDFGGVLEGRALTDPQGDFEGRAYRRWLRATVRAEGELGRGKLGLVLARDVYAKRWVEELDYRAGPLTFFGAPIFPNGLQPIRQPIDIHAWTAQLTYDAPLAPRLEGRVGAFLQDMDKGRTDDFGPLLFGAAPPRYDTSTTQTAVFGALDWRALDTVTLSGALRWDGDDRTQIVRNTATGAVLDRRSATFARVQPQIAARWRVRDDLVAYATYGEAFRTGGFNPIPAPTSIWRARFEPETTKSLEAGVKLRNLPLDGAIELAAFRGRIAQYQNYTFLDGQSVTLNVDSVTLDGLDLTARVSPAAWLTAETALAMADARIDRFVAPDPLGSGGVRTYGGKRVPNAPKWTATTSLTATRPLGAHTLDLRLDVHTRGPTVYEIDNALRSPAVTWVDLRASVRRGSWRASAWAKNLTDERWAISAFGQGMLPLLQGLGPGGPFDTFTVNRGRSIGVDLTRQF
ncbi:MAG: TonB-dependent receptor [Alphaproteobacteria bacterium]|nr:TonB-dependent receptor [Alphaproteobacteria bacterium]